MVENGNVASPWDASLISLLPPSLVIFAAGGAGYDYMDVPALRSRGVRFCNSRGAGDTATSDIALYLILACFRLTSFAEWGARQGDPDTFWRVHHEVGLRAENPRGRLLGCVGLGNIQREVARKAGKNGLGMDIVYYDPYRLGEDVERSLGVTYVDSLDKLAECGCDLISVSGASFYCSLAVNTADGYTTVPYTKSTHDLIDARFISKLKPGARIVNTARGKIVNEDALVAALESGHLLSAGLDVHYHEPRVSPALIGMKNVTLTAHVGGVAKDTFVEFERLCMANIDNNLRLGKPCLTVRALSFVTY